MDRYYILKDGCLIAMTFNKEEAVEIIHTRQARETHYLLRSEFSIIKGEPQEFVKYPNNIHQKKE